jgi:hypothetical protein
MAFFEGAVEKKLGYALAVQDFLPMVMFGCGVICAGIGGALVCVVCVATVALFVSSNLQVA